MALKDLYDKINRAQESQVKNCLKAIVAFWFVTGKKTLDPNKELNSDTIMSITEVLKSYNFYPKD